MNKPLSFMFILVFFFFFIPSFILADEGEILFHDVIGKSFSIFRVRPDGSGLREVIKYGAYPVWSRDRKKIAYISLTSDTKEPHSLSQLGISDSTGKELFKVEGIKSDFKDVEVNKFTIDYEWSHEGNQLAFATILNDSLHLQIFDIRSKKITNICQKNVDDAARAYLNTKIIWTFDDKSIFLTSPMGGIEVINLQSGVINYIIPPGILSSLSEGEDKIIFAFQKGDLTSLWSIDKQGRRGNDFEIKGKLSPVSGPIKNNLLVVERCPEKISRTFLLDLRSQRKDEIQGGNVHLFSASLSPKGDKLIAVGITYGNQKNINVEHPQAGYYILDLKTKNINPLRKFSNPRDEGYWMNVYLGRRRDYSWR